MVGMLMGAACRLNCVIIYAVTKELGSLREVRVAMLLVQCVTGITAALLWSPKVLLFFSKHHDSLHVKYG